MPRGQGPLDHTPVTEEAWSNCGQRRPCDTATRLTCPKPVHHATLRGCDIIAAMQTPPPLRYGVKEQLQSETAAECAAEEVRVRGWSVVRSGLSSEQLDDLRERLDTIRLRQREQVGAAALATMGEDAFIRLPLAHDSAFLELARHPEVLAVMERIFDGYFILMLQNGVWNDPEADQRYLLSYHRDLPYQHLVTSRPIAVNAMFCLDEFSPRSGGTVVLPGSNRIESFPSDAYIAANEMQLSAPAGSFVLFDAMLYHRAGRNHGERVRRGVNMVYSLAFLKQQISLPDALGPGPASDPQLRQLLGYESAPSKDLGAWYAARRARFGLD